jgi:hypothetical protein
VQGSSALEGVLERVPGAVDVFVVWEAVLPSDLLPPASSTLARLKDPRAWQLWDRGHLVSDAMRAGMRAHPSAIPIARQRRHGHEEGVLWDAVAVFPPGARWDLTLPAPAYLDGDVVDVVAAIQAQLTLPRGPGTP